MKNKATINKKIGKLVNLDRKLKGLPRITLVEKQVLDKEHAFEAVYYSNKLEGNKLTKEEARKAILPDV